MILFLRTMLFTAWVCITVLAFLPNYSNLPEVVSISDLLNHTVAFATLFFLYRHAYQNTTKQIIIALFIYAVFIEFVQAFLPTRSASLSDIAADCVGILIGYYIWRIRSRLLPLGSERN